MTNKYIVNMEIHNATEYDLYGNRAARKAALEQALRTREFEISLYWKRTAYFWAFIVSIYVAYFNVFVIKESSENLTFIRPASLIALSFLGFFFSLAWFMVNKGSKFWQENWEIHVSMLEDDVIGPLYKTHLNPDYASKFGPTSAFDFSVSKVNMVASFVVGFCAVCFFIWNIHHFFFDLVCLFYCEEFVNLNVYARTFGVAFLIIAMTVGLVFWLCQGNKKTSKKFLVRKPREI